MKVEVITPEEYMGDVVGDINRHVGSFKAWVTVHLVKQLTRKFHCLKCLNATDLRSLTQGRVITRWSLQSTFKRLITSLKR